MRAWKGELGSSLKGLLPKWHGPFQARLTPSVIPSEVEESLILTITSSKRSLDCARHNKKPIWATRPVNAMRAQFVLHYLASSIFPSAELDSSAFRDAVYGLWPLLLVHF